MMVIVEVFEILACLCKHKRAIALYVDVGCSLSVALGRSCPFLQQTKNDGSQSVSHNVGTASAVISNVEFGDRKHSFSRRFLSFSCLGMSCCVWEFFEKDPHLKCALTPITEIAMGIIWLNFLGMCYFTALEHKEKVIHYYNDVTFMMRYSQHCSSQYSYHCQHSIDLICPESKRNSSAFPFTSIWFALQD